MGSELAEDGQKNTLSAFGRTSVGRLREHNEDSFVLADLSLRTRVDSQGLERASLGPSGALFAVCDGMGGAAAGEVASKLAAEHLYESLIDLLSLHPGSKTSHGVSLRRSRWRTCVYWSERGRRSHLAGWVPP